MKHNTFTPEVPTPLLFLTQRHPGLPYPITSLCSVSCCFLISVFGGCCAAMTQLLPSYEKKNIPAKCISLSEAMWSKNIYFSALSNYNVMFEVWILLALILKPPIRFSTQTEHRRYSFYTIYTHQSKHKTVEKKNILYQTLIKRTKE